MNGPPFTAGEIAAKLAHQISQLTDMGVDPARAAVEVAKRYAIEPAFVARVVATVATADPATTPFAA